MTAKLQDRGRPIDERHPESVAEAHRARVEAGLDDIRNGRIATPEDVEAAYERLARLSR